MGLKLIPLLFLIVLTSCSNQEVKQVDTVKKIAPLDTNTLIIDQHTDAILGLTPPMVLIKDDKKLSIVKIMDGGICKDDLEGAKGEFILYADNTDVERLKREKGNAIFKTFESQIQELASNVLHTAIENTNLSVDPFSLGADEAQQTLANQFVVHFRKATLEAISQFQKDTTLSIEIFAFKPSLFFYQKGCNEARLEEDPAAPSH